ncbi:chemotaxis protein [Marinobacter daepoensis]|uniref:Chemotaxis protein n=1 Tax=Marinobacter daepoensis TaxID=262077 RepID=A0ABS3BAT5_9GAMM|nr:chemotaxis protein [Marinobacter daepoensis]MBN7768976.1 chemotaxis protein [Marinobacter daepoensis]MBY6032419.1 chemotaxis protein [Marinobacter daepoensis]MBY6077666.1 chemotaxis protein [Marinobacter daepoensis]
MVQSSLATKSQSFDLVKSEIEQTIKQAESSLERFQENRESGEDLQNCVDYINQLRGIFILVELRGGTLLCQEAVYLANDVPVGANDDKNILLTALNSALFILRRYVEYYHQQREDHPELLLPVINDLREARREKPYPESCFFEIDTKERPDFCGDLSLKSLDEGDSEYEILARRMRLTFQVALLGILRDRNDTVSKKLMARSARGLARLCQGAPMGQMWCLLALVSDTMLDRAMGFNKARKRLLMRIERYAREVVYVGKVATAKDAPESLIKDLVYLLYRSGSANPEVTRVLTAYRLAPAEFPDAILEAHSRRLYGPGADVLKSLSEALQEELNQLKDKLDIIERGIEPDLAELASIADSLERLANTLVMLDLSRLAGISREEAKRLRKWEEENRLPAEDELYRLADSVLGVEDAVMQIVTRGITSETDALAGAERSREESVYLQEAVWVVADEARSALTLAKRAITAFIESDYDKLHLANLPGTLRSIWGGLQMVDDPMAADVIARVAASIQDQLLDAREAPSPQVLEALADALTSLEYYIEGVGRREDRNVDLLKLAQSSLDDVGL